MPTTYATVEEYRLDTGDHESAADRVLAVLTQQSAKLRARLQISEKKRLTADQQALARLLVTDAARKTLVPPTLDGFGDITGAKAASFSANGFQGSVTIANQSGSAYFDRDTLNVLKRSLGRSARISVICPW